VALHRKIAESTKDGQPAGWRTFGATIAHNLESLFPVNIQGIIIPSGLPTLAWHLKDEADDLLLAINEELRKRHLGGSTVRLEIRAS